MEELIQSLEHIVKTELKMKKLITDTESKIYRRNIIGGRKIKEKSKQKSYTYFYHNGDILNLKRK